MNKQELIESYKVKIDECKKEVEILLKQREGFKSYGCEREAWLLIGAEIHAYDDLYRAYVGFIEELKEME